MYLYIFQHYLWSDYLFSSQQDGMLRKHNVNINILHLGKVVWGTKLTFEYNEFLIVHHQHMRLVEKNCSEHIFLSHICCSIQLVAVSCGNTAQSQPLELVQGLKYRYFYNTIQYNNPLIPPAPPKKKSYGIISHYVRFSVSAVAHSLRPDFKKESSLSAKPVNLWPTYAKQNARLESL